MSEKVENVGKSEKASKGKKWFHELEWYLDDNNVPTCKELWEDIKRLVARYKELEKAVKSDSTPQIIKESYKNHNMPRVLNNIEANYFALNMYYRGYAEGSERDRSFFAALLGTNNNKKDSKNQE